MRVIAVTTPHKKNHLLPCSLLGISFWALMSVNASLWAADCGVLHFQKNRSSKTNVHLNQCPSDTDLSLGTELELGVDARVWLESFKTNASDNNMQIMCQNKSSSPVKIKIAKPYLTWIEPLGFDQCNTWMNKKLTCLTTDAKIGLKCAITARSQIADKRQDNEGGAVIVRGFKKLKLISNSAIIEPDIQLCREILNINTPFALTATLKASGEVVNAAMPALELDPQFVGCALEALNNHNFPSVTVDTPINMKF